MEKINNGMVKIGVKQEDLEDSIGGAKTIKADSTGTGIDWQWKQ